MKPIRVFTHVACEPPGYIQTLLERLSLPFEQVCLADGKEVPMDLDSVQALVFMGGPGDVNQPTDWMRQEFELIQTAQNSGVPVLGICLGAQLMSVALGGHVWPGESMEVGFHEVRRLPSDNPWFAGLPSSFTAFQWHAHNISPPAGVASLATSDCVPCQAYAVGPSLALQFHLEMTESIINGLIEKYADDLQQPSECVHSAQRIRRNIGYQTKRTFAIADQLMARWFQSVNAQQAPGSSARAVDNR